MKVLLIRFSSAGDILLCADSVKALKKEKKAEVHMLVKQKFMEAAQLTDADTVKTVDFSGGFSALKMAADKLSAENYDMAVDLQGNLRSFIIMSLMKCAVKKSVKKYGIKRRLTVVFKWFLKKIMPISTLYTNAAGIAPVIPGNKKARAGGIVVLHAGAMWKNKRWPYMAELAEKLTKLKAVKRVIITGVKDEVEKDGELLYIKSGKIKNMIGKTGFKELAGIIEKASLFIGNDTAAAHLASLYGVPAIVFLGPTVESFGFVTPERFTVIQKDLGCRPCHLHGGKICPVGSFECMKGISVREAFGAVLKILNGVK